VDTSRPEGHFVVLAGLTGTGKTALLRELASAGEAVLDLEALASHRGSVIGGIGLPPQPSHRIFQQRIADVAAGASPERPIWIEDEGPYLGSVGLPVWLQRACARAPVISLEASVAVRIARLAGMFAYTHRAAVAAAIRSLAPRVGQHRAAAAATRIEAGAWSDAVEMLLPYYDEAYAHRQGSMRRPTIARFAGAVPPSAPAVIAVQRAAIYS
jgi:tRNA 2-selenouridine synthase